MKEKLARYQARIEQVLDRCLTLPDSGTARLREGMRYSVLGGGKRIFRNDGVLRQLRLLDGQLTDTGAFLATYEAAT